MKMGRYEKVMLSETKTKHVRKENETKGKCETKTKLKKT